MIAVGGRATITETFTENKTWTSPDGVTSINMTGRGQHGTNDTLTSTFVFAAIGEYKTTGSGSIVGGTGAWENLQNAANYNQNLAIAGGTVDFIFNRITQFADGTQNQSLPTAQFKNVTPGSAVLIYGQEWRSSGPILTNGFAQISFTYMLLGVAGAASSGFGRTFSGGPANGLAVQSSYSNVPVTPNTPYNVVVPAGGFITITY